MEQIKVTDDYSNNLTQNIEVYNDISLGAFLRELRKHNIMVWHEIELEHGLCPTFVKKRKGIRFRVPPKIESIKPK